MEPMSVLLTIWGVLTTVLVVLLIYRSALARHEDDELFLTSAEAHFEREQQELTVRMDRLRPFAQCTGRIQRAADAHHGRTVGVARLDQDVAFQKVALLP